VKKNHVTFGMLFTWIMRNIAVNVYEIAPFARALQLKGVTFIKMGIVDNFLEYAQKHIKRKVKKETKEEP